MDSSKCNQICIETQPFPKVFKLRTSMVAKMAYISQVSRNYSNSSSSRLRESFLKSKSNYNLILPYLFCCDSLIDAQEAFPDMELAVLKELYVQANRSKPVLFEMCF